MTYWSPSRLLVYQLGAESCDVYQLGAESCDCTRNCSALES